MSISKHHYTYLLTDEVGKMYIGARSCVCLPKDDVYWSSSKYVHEAKQQGKKFTKQILSVWPTRQEAVMHEIFLHEVFDVAKNESFYNKSKQTALAFDTSGHEVAEQTKQKRRSAMEKRYGTLKKDYRLLETYGTKHKPKGTCKGWPKGKKQSQEMIAKRSKAQIGKTGMQNNRGAKPVFAINLLTKEAKLLIGKANISESGFDPATVHKICNKKPGFYTNKKHIFRFLLPKEIEMFV